MITRTLWCLILLSTTLGAEAHAHLPLTFEANRGQLDARVDFVVRSAGYTGFLSSGDLYLHLDPAGGAMPSSGLVIALAGRADGAPLGEELTAGRSHYLLGSDPEQWVRAVPHWRRVRYRDVYPGIDVVQVVFDLGAWDRGRELVIDPPLQFSTFLGGTLAELGNDVAVDAAGNAYVVGWTRSADFPVTPGVLQETKTGDATRANLFLAKLDPTGTSLVYSTYLGASSNVFGEAVAVDAFGRATVLARAGASSDLFTTANAVQSTVGLFEHTYVATLDADGAGFLYASFLSSINGSGPAGVAVDAIGDLYVAGNATSLSFPRVGGFQTAMAGISDAFFVKLDPLAVDSLVYATFLGGAGSDGAEDLAVDAAGRAYLTGLTRSADFPVLNAAQPSRSGASDAFAAAIDPGLTGAASLIYATYLGGGSDENGTVDDGGVAVDDLGFATYGGTTFSADLPTSAGAFQSAFAGGTDGFVYRLDPAGAVVFTTYFGGSGIEQLKDLDVDEDGRVALFGLTLSSNLPVLDPFQASRTNSSDLFLTVLAAGGGALVQSSYLGGDSGAAEHAGGVAFDPSAAAVVAAGHAAPGSSFFPFPTTPGSFQPIHAGETDAFVVRWPVPALVLEVPVDVIPGKCPNQIKLRGGGQVKVMIASTATFDAAGVDPASIRVLGLAPLQSSVKDMATPFVPFFGKTLASDCNALGADGLPDLEVRIDKRDLVDALETLNGGPLVSGQVFVIPLTGKLLPAFGGSDVVGEDVVVLQ